MVIICFILASCGSDDERSVNYVSGEVSEEVYVWQRVWTPEVASAVETRLGEFERCFLLGAEISFLNGEWSCQPFESPLKWASESAGEFGVKCGLAFRIDALAASTGWSDEDCYRVVDYIRSYVGYTDVIQIDYDCPSLKLRDYGKLLAHLRVAFPDTRLEITCLTDWLRYDEFSDLVHLVDRYVMQVHGVSGLGKGQKMVLCNTDYAYEVATQCAGLGVPYIMALPTYRHAVSYGSNGKINQVASEGEFLKSEYELAYADPVALSALMNQWREMRPELMEGVIWYRLPVETDRMNWTWDTFVKVREGEFKENAMLEIKLEKESNGLVNVIISNNSEQHIDWVQELVLSWAGSGFCIAQEMSHYKVADFERSRGMRLYWSRSNPYPIGPGGRVVCGKLRFTDEIELKDITINQTP